MPEFRESIKQIKYEAKGVKTFIFPRLNGFRFYPGQYCWLSLPDFDPSPMAIASGTEDTTLEFSIRKWGKLTEALFQKSKGDEVKIEGPYGSYFPVERVQDGDKLYLIAGGTGITPIRSLVKSLSSIGQKELFYGAKNADELLYQYEFDEWDAKINLTVDSSDETWSGQVGLVTELLELHELDSSALCFVCGPSPMERAVVQFLRKRGFNDENIFVSLERFDEEGNVVGPVLPVNDPQVEF